MLEFLPNWWSLALDWSEGPAARVRAGIRAAALAAVAPKVRRPGGGQVMLFGFGSNKK